jgi:putative membrane protein
MAHRCTMGAVLASEAHLAAAEEPLEREDERANEPMLSPRRRPSLKQQFTNSAVIDELLSRTRQATQSSSLTYNPETWNNTLTTLGTGGPLVLKPWAILTLCSLVLAILHETALHGANLSIPNEVVIVLGGTMSLLLAFRLNSSYSRWWEARQLWGNLIIGVRQIVIELVTDGRIAGQEALQLSVAGWSIAFAVALKHHLRGEKIAVPPPSPSAEGSESPSRHLTAEDAISQLGAGPLRLLSDKDKQALASSKSAPLYALARLRQAVREATSSSGPAADLNQFRIHELMVLALTGCERILRTPCPPGYVGMLRSVMVAWLLFLPFTLIEDMSFFMVPIYSLTAFLVLKVEQLAVEIENPFGMDFNDLPLEAFCLTVESDALRLFAEFDTDDARGSAPSTPPPVDVNGLARSPMVGSPLAGSGFGVIE